MKKYYIYDFDVIGKLTITEENDFITNIDFEGTYEENKNAILEESKLIRKAYSQLKEYFEGSRKKFDLPIKADGTAFQSSCWNEFIKIPYGNTRSYKQIAESVGSPKACRAVGMAANRNPIGIIIPCHRILGADGALVGFGGGLKIKEYLLSLEKNN
ncbi:MAG: methylated-DNA--[protein]-cysteine S-methyltransferase [Synergistaceae bacterium]|nr:methylated-DNA--[protein]-cysteine S-methyltransferase [Synergistaceae bacterium]